MSNGLDLCCTCNEGHLQPSGEVVVEGESADVFQNIGSRRVFTCRNCGQRQVRVGHQQYVNIGDDVKTEPESEKT